MILSPDCGPLPLIINATTSVVIKLSVLSDLSDIYTFGPTLGVHLEDQMSDRKLERQYYVFGHNYLIIHPTKSYDLSMDSLGPVECGFSMQYMEDKIF